MNRLTKSKDGYISGYSKGFNKGYEEGYNRGKDAGRVNFLTPFQGTSIIIPTYNKVDYLKECIESIKAYTPEPYELIIIDNASEDGTADYLKFAGGIRYRINAQNLGFAGSVNQGLMLARGKTLMILNNDSVVTPHWLANLLTCLHQRPNDGIIGPVTNYISGDQLIATDYTSMPEMQAFSRDYNHSDPAKWTVTGRLTGFCMLMKRELFHRLGYFDEGFEIGNCEDDDYGLRARMLGMELVIAKDTFIHHYGSVSMKSLNDRFDEIYEKNLQFYAMKWSDPHQFLSLAWQSGFASTALRMTDLYPTCVIVKGASSNIYWVENGFRYLIDDAARGIFAEQAVRLSQIDLHNWTLGGVFAVEEVLQRLAAMREAAAGASQVEGMLVQTTDGSVYQYRSGSYHRFLNPHSLAAWKLDLAYCQPADEERINRQKGAPIIAPPLIKADNL